MKFPMITAHTGCMGSKPNTIASVLEGINRGADIIEMDIRATRDGIVVLAHDDCVEVLSHGSQKIEDLCYEDLYKNVIEIVRLEEAMELIRDANKTANIDLKSGTVVDAMARTIKDMGMMESVLLTGCGKEMASKITESYKGFQVLMDVDEKLLLAGDYDYGALVKMWCRDAVEASCCAFNIPYEVCTEELVERAAKRCLPVCLYTIDEAELMKKYADMGVFSITTNRVDLLKNLR